MEQYELLEVHDQVLTAGQKAALLRNSGQWPTLDGVRQHIVFGADLVLKAIRSFANSSLTPGAKYCSEKPLVAFGPSGIQTSSDRLGKPGLILIVRFGHSRWY